MTTRFYKISHKTKEDGRKYGELRLYAQSANIGSVGSGSPCLSFDEESASYFSFTPGQIQHPSVKEMSEEELTRIFEAQMNRTGLKWTRFDLADLLKQI
jgi:hypothetical protein